KKYAIQHQTLCLTLILGAADRALLSAPLRPPAPRPRQAPPDQHLTGRRAPNPKPREDAPVTILSGPLDGALVRGKYLGQTFWRLERLKPLLHARGVVTVLRRVDFLEPILHAFDPNRVGQGYEVLQIIRTIVSPSHARA